jgi:hypothetical protein
MAPHYPQDIRRRPDLQRLCQKERERRLGGGQQLGGVTAAARRQNLKQRWPLAKQPRLLRIRRLPSFLLMRSESGRKQRRRRLLGRRKGMLLLPRLGKRQGLQ